MHCCCLSRGWPGSSGVAQQACGATWRNLVKQGVARSLWQDMAGKQLSQLWQLRWQQEQTQQSCANRLQFHYLFVALQPFRLQLTAGSIATTTSF